MARSGRGQCSAAFAVCLAAVSLTVAVGRPSTVLPAPARDAGEASPARRVVIFPPVLDFYLTVDRTAAHVLATSKVDRQAVIEGLLGQVYPAAREIGEAPTAGAYSKIPGDPEALLAAGADAVFAWPSAAASLRRDGVPAIDTDERDPAALCRLMAIRAGKEGRAAFLSSYVDALQRDLDRTLSGMADDDGPRVLILWRTGGDFAVALDANPAAALLRRTKARNAAAGLTLPVIDSEELLRLDPQVILLPCCGAADDGPERFYGDPALGPLRAVRQRRIYRMPAFGGGFAGGLLDPALSARWLAELLYPDRLSADFRAIVRKTYEDVYGTTPGAAPLDRALFLAQNTASAAYERFRH